jgi:hypothetical protein
MRDAKFSEGSGGEAMNIKYSRLSTGYHHVRATDFSHLFAQWPVGAELEQQHVSFGESEIGEQTLIDFMTEAQQMATGVTPNDGEVKP